MAILSPGNIKLGKMPNVSLPPVVTCNGCGEHCGKKCYSMKAYRMYPPVRKMWDKNLELAKTNMDQYFSQILAEIQAKRKPVKFFRWHVSGDILNLGYFASMCLLAARLHETRFLVFTKQYRIVNEYLDSEATIPKNLQVVFSAWPGMPMKNPYNLRVAWMQDGAESRIPSSVIECPGSCETCSACFSLDAIGKDVMFELH